MNHEEYRDLLSALLDGELDEAQRASALAHLDECEECRAYYAELCAVHDAIAELEPETVPAGFAESVMARLLEGEKVVKLKKRSPWRGWTALAACAAVVVLAVGVTQNSRKSANTNTMEMAPAAPAAGYREEGAEEPSTGGSMLMQSMTMAPAGGVNDAAADLAEYEGNESVVMTVPTADANPAEKAEGLREAELLLYGEDAEFWLWNHGEYDDAEQGYWVDRETLSELPEGLSLGTSELVARWNASERSFAFVRAADAEAQR
ncbi:MAG: zf-HC2 domain-containing protein [Oscillospiraceae bacterium]|nr:zf-HC2 domain-containing protein [Oscillospiraceae bacterium]